MTTYYAKYEKSPFDYDSYWSWKFKPDQIKERFQLVKSLLKKAPEHDTIAVSGTSGVWLAPLLILEGKNVVLVRKEGEYSHGKQVEGHTGAMINRFIVVDDLICSGKTVRYIEGSLLALSPRNKMVGIVLYDQNYPTSEFEVPCIHRAKVSYG